MVQKPLVQLTHGIDVTFVDAMEYFPAHLMSTAVRVKGPVSGYLTSQSIFNGAIYNRAMRPAALFMAVSFVMFLLTF